MRRFLAPTVAVLVLWTNAPVRSQGAAGTDRPAARVNGEAIPYSQLAPLLQRSAAIPQGLSDDQKRELRRETLGLLIDDLLITQFLRTRVPEIAPREVSRKMDELRAALKEKKQSLADFCKESNQTEANIRVSIAQHLQWAAYVEKHVHEQELRKYHEANRDIFDRVTVQVSHIFLQLSPLSGNRERADERRKLQQVRDQIIAGKLDFAAAARAYSHCPSGQNGGSLGARTRQDFDESFAKVAFGLKEGEVSNVVETDAGLHLIAVKDRKVGKPSTFAHVREEVKRLYVEEMMQHILAEQRTNAKIEILLP